MREAFRNLNRTLLIVKPSARKWGNEDTLGSVGPLERFGFKVVAEGTVPKTNIGIWLMARNG
jgi:hypothetical protein